MLLTKNASWNHLGSTLKCDHGVNNCFFLYPNRLMTPQLVFRLIFVMVLTLIPVSVYQSSKILGLRPLHGASLCLLTFAIQSWRKFGLEISAFIEYGLLTQAFGMLLLFPVGMQVFMFNDMTAFHRVSKSFPMNFFEGRNFYQNLQSSFREIF